MMKNAYKLELVCREEIAPAERAVELGFWVSACARAACLMEQAAATRLVLEDGEAEEDQQGGAALIASVLTAAADRLFDFQEPGIGDQASD
jgi:hypothetical protein